MPEWIHFSPSALYWLAGSSLVMFLVSVLLVPWMIISMPADYFQGEKRRRALWALRHPVIRFLIQTGRTALGALFILAGLAMLALPGQGALTILMGVLLANFPGKYRLERWLASRPMVLVSINWLRRKAKREPLSLEEESPLD